MLTTIEGVYRNGKVELNEIPKTGHGRRVLVTYLESDGEAETSPAQFIRLGMLPQLRTLTDEDFKAAEFHGDSNEGLDWSGL